ncbi:MAG: hypothetical protein RBT61_10080 [Candidatus Kapabacteria bacterium]|jgi:hypothetical protein|nr:hypothetical protein [Candidatus Kapabacteria bacterium]
MKNFEKLTVYVSKVMISLFILLVMASCDIFTTRSPENPNTGNTNFLPPTEPSIVLLNLVTALEEKNIDNYMNCFHSFTDESEYNLEFTASAEATTQFPSIFINWGVSEERRSFSAILAAVSTDRTPELKWINRKPFQETADSAVFTSDYIINIPGNDNTIPHEFAGRLQFTMTFRENGLWYISRWVDFNITVSDSIKNTWSMLKAYYYN